MSRFLREAVLMLLRGNEMEICLTEMEYKQKIKLFPYSFMLFEIFSTFLYHYCFPIIPHKLSLMIHCRVDST
jgi:hypothetical protein